MEPGPRHQRGDRAFGHPPRQRRHRHAQGQGQQIDHPDIPAAQLREQQLDQQIERPVPQIDAVRILAEQRERAPQEQAGHPGSLGDAARDQDHGQHGGEDQPAAECRLVLIDARHEQDQADQGGRRQPWRRRPHRLRRRGAGRLVAVHRKRERHAEQQPEAVHVGAEIDAGRIVAGPVQYPHAGRGQRRQRHGHTDARRCRPDAAEQRHDQRQQHDGLRQQRDEPQVPQQLRRGHGEVAAAGGDLVPVRAENHGGEAFGRHADERVVVDEES